MDKDQPGAEGAGDEQTRRHPNPDSPDTMHRLLADDMAFAPSTYNAERGTVDVIWSTGAQVQRSDWWTGERWLEELDLAGADLARLNAGGPLLLDHWSSVDNVAGSVVPGTAKVEGGRGVATLRFDRSGAAGIQAERKVAGGHLRTVSIGYRVQVWDRVRAQKDGELDRKVARKFEIFEISIVPMPADAGAVMRSVAPPGSDATATRAGDAARNPETKMTKVNEPGATDAPKIDAEAERKQVREAELDRVRGIQKAGQALGIDEGAVRAALDGGETLADAQSRFIGLLEAKRAKEGALKPGGVDVIRDERDTTIRRWEGALTARFLGQAPAEESREFAGMGLLSMARQLAGHAGVRGVHRMSADDLAEWVLSRQQGSGDFPLVLGNSMNKSVQGLFGAYPNTWGAWTRETDVADFKTITAASIGQFPEVAEIAEGAPYTMGSIAEEGQTFAVKERGRLAQLTRVALVNDDMRALQNVLSNAALAGYTNLRRIVFGILTANGVWPSGGSTALFHVDRGNIGTAGNLDAAKYSELRALLAKQTSPAAVGEAAAPLPPPVSVVLLVGPDEEDTAMELLGNRIVPTATGAVIPDGYRANTSLVMEPFLDTGNDPYYLCRSDIRGVEIAYLQGRRAPQVTSAEDIRYSGMTFRVVFDFGAAAVQPRVMAANLG